MADRHPASVVSATFTMAILIALFAAQSARAQYIPSPDSPTTSINDTGGACSAYRADADGSEPVAAGSCCGTPPANDPIVIRCGEYTDRICDIQAGTPGTPGKALPGTLPGTLPGVRPGVRRYGNQSEVNDAFSYGWDNNVRARAATDEAGDVAMWIRAQLPQVSPSNGGDRVGRPFPWRRLGSLTTLRSWPPRLARNAHRAEQEVTND